MASNTNLKHEKISERITGKLHQFGIKLMYNKYHISYHFPIAQLGLLEDLLQKTAGIPTDSNCDPLPADLFLHLDSIAADVVQISS